MIRIFPHVVLHDFWPRRQFDVGTFELSHSPTSIPHVARARLVGGDIILDFIGDFPEMSMMLHGSSEAQIIKDWRPILESIFDDNSIIGARVGVGAGRIDRIMVIGEAIEVGVVETV